MTPSEETRKRIAEKWANLNSYDSDSERRCLKAILDFWAEYGTELEAQFDNIDVLARATELSAENARLREELVVKEIQRTELFSQINQLHTQLSETRNALHASEAARKLELSELLAAQDELGETKTKLAEVEKERDTWKRRAEEKVKPTRVLGEELETARNKLLSQSALIARLREALAEIEESPYEDNPSKFLRMRSTAYKALSLTSDDSIGERVVKELARFRRFLANGAAKQRIDQILRDLGQEDKR